jgi:hypothetical protein
LFDIPNKRHASVGHGSRDRMIFELKQKYCNITKVAIVKFLNFVSTPRKNVFILTDN